MDNQGSFSMQDAMRLANSPAGQQLMAMLNQQNNADLEKAMASAAAGDYSHAKKVLSSLLSDPKAVELLNQLGGK